MRVEHALIPNLDRIFQTDIRKQIADTLLRQLLDVKGSRLAAQDDPFGKELDIEIA